MLFFIDGHIDLRRLAPDEVQSLLQEEVAAVRRLKESGGFVAAVRTEAEPLQGEAPRVLGIVQTPSRSELEQVLARLPLAPYFSWDEVVPVVEL